MYRDSGSVLKQRQLLRLGQRQHKETEASRLKRTYFINSPISTRCVLAGSAASIAVRWGGRWFRRAVHGAVPRNHGRITRWLLRLAVNRLAIDGAVCNWPGGLALWRIAINAWGLRLVVIQHGVARRITAAIDAVSVPGEWSAGGRRLVLRRSCDVSNLTVLD